MSEQKITIRPFVSDDLMPCAEILFTAFYELVTKAGLKRVEFTFESSKAVIRSISTSPDAAGFVAVDQRGTIVGSNFVAGFDDPVCGVGPISVSPTAQGSGAGRLLMEAVISKGKEKTNGNIRLWQDAFNMTSLSLYTSLGFDVKITAVLMGGYFKLPTGFSLSPAVRVRPMETKDADACAALNTDALGFPRHSIVKAALGMKTAFVAERDGHVVAYIVNPHAYQVSCTVAKTEDDVRQLIAGVGVALGPHTNIEFLMPLRYSNLHRWAMSAGLRNHKCMNHMSMGMWHEPKNVYLPQSAY